MPVDYMKIIEKYYDEGSTMYDILVKHSRRVAKKAIEIAKRVPELNPNLQFIEEAAMLHDIGIHLTKSEDIDCQGEEQYLKHGILGRELLEKEGLPRHALVCERHTGVGISKEEIIRDQLPLPKRDLIPVSIEEEIICFADRFFSKNPERDDRELTIDEIKNGLRKYGKEKVKKFDAWCKKFKEPG